MKTMVSEEVKPDCEKHKRIMRAYANLDKDFGYEMCYNWLVTTLLHYNNN